MLRQPLLLVASVLVMTTLVTGCSSRMFHSGVGPSIQNQAVSAITVPSGQNVVNEPTASLPTTEPAPKSNDKYPQHATKQIVPEIWAVPAGDVAITIDDGPSPYTEQIIRVLNKYHVQATFFFIGNQVAQWPDAVRAAYAAGDVIGNHSESHPKFTDLSPADQQDQIVTAQQAIEQIGIPAPTLFRPPYGGYNDFTEQALVKDHLTLALWNRDPRDWADTNPQQVIDGVVNGNPSGAIFDMHDKLLTLQALPTIIEKLQQRGLHFVVIGREIPSHPPGSGTGSGTGATTGSQGRGGSNSTNSTNSTTSTGNTTGGH